MKNQILLSNVVFHLGLVLSAFLLLCLIFLTIFLVYVTKKKTKNDISDFNTRIYRYDFKNKIVTSIDKKNMRNSKQFNQLGFNNEFAEEDRSKVFSWIRDLIANKAGVSKYLPVQVVLSKMQKGNSIVHTHALLELTKINKEEGYIHIESHLLPHISKSKNILIKEKKSVIVDIDTLYNLVEQRKIVGRFITYLINLSVKPNLNVNSDLYREDLEQLRFEIINELSKEIDERIYIVNYEKDKIVLVLNREYIQSYAITEGLRFLNIAKKVASLNNSDEFCAIGVGYSFCSSSIPNKTDVDNTINYAFVASKNAISSGDTADLVQIYEGKRRNQEDSNAIAQIVSIIENKMYDIRFRPVLDLKNKLVVGYRCFISANLETKALNFEELCKLSSKFGLGKEFYHSVLDFISSNLKEKYPSRIFVDFKFNHLVEMLKESIYSDSNLELVTCLGEKDLTNYPSELLIEKINTANNFSIRLALYTSDSIIEISDDVIQTFNYYIINDRITSNIVDDQRGQTLLSFILERLSTYNKDIICFDNNSISSIKYCLHNDINIFSTQELNPLGGNLIEWDDKFVDALEGD